MCVCVSYYVPVCVLLADGDDGATSEKRMRLVRSKSSSSSLSQMNDASNTGGAVVQVDCPTWGNKGLQLAKFGQSSQILSDSFCFVWLFH